ncbi:hypothetical protein BTVI_13667 [Pitangus sulphuratus]|nr:hypothetical protein BTVI_13667 [Pitangus sulphuratus]
MKLDGSEAKQLGSLSQDTGIDKGIGKRTETLSLQSCVRERYLFKGDLVVYPCRQNTMEKGIQYLRELAVVKACISLAKRLSKDIQQFITEEFHAPSVRTTVYTITKKCHSAQGRRYTPLGPKRTSLGFGITAVETEEIRQRILLLWHGMRAKERYILIVTTAVHCRQYCTKYDSMTPIHEMIHELESHREVSKMCSPYNSPIWPVCKSNGEWRLTVDYRGPKEVTPSPSAAVQGMVGLQ